MGLHLVSENDVHKHRCDVCGESAVWYDGQSEVQLGKQSVTVGENKGLVYATCDCCKKKVCGMENLRPSWGRIRVLRMKLPGHYKGSPCCMLEGHYVNHYGRDTFFVLCRDSKCQRSFEEDARQKRIKAGYG